MSRTYSFTPAEIESLETVPGFDLPAPRRRHGVAALLLRQPLLRQPLLREPLLHFLVAGALVFVLAEAVEHHRSQYRIELTPQQELRIFESYRQQYGALPAPEQSETLLRNYVKEEILYREAVALGLDSEDEIVRRRLAQKYSFLLQDLVALDRPSEAEVRRFYIDNRARYTQAERRAFTHVYFSPDAGGDAAARSRAAEALLRLQHDRPERAPDLGDDFPGASDLPEVDADTTARLFGTGELASRIFDATPGEWSGPYRSGFGWHLVRVTAQEPSRELSFEDVAERVRQDLIDSRRAALNEKALADIAAKYTVVTADD
jgi:peptidyl-prolyl cis-trans isomerase C